MRVAKNASLEKLALRIEPLAEHPEVLPVLQAWFEWEWPAYYGATGRGNARRDLHAYANPAGLPFGVVAFRQGAVCGVAALAAVSIATHAHLSPWAAAMGFRSIYCGTSTAEGLLQRTGWRLLERVNQDGEVLGIYEKALRPC